MKRFVMIMSILLITGFLTLPAMASGTDSHYPEAGLNQLLAEPGGHLAYMAYPQYTPPERTREQPPPERTREQPPPEKTREQPPPVPITPLPPVIRAEPTMNDSVIHIPPAEHPSLIPALPQVTAPAIPTPIDIDPDLIYGHEPFARRDIDLFHTTEGARAPETYILGPGDLIRITIFGASQADMLLEINSEGYVRTTEIPQIYLKGLSIAQARDLLIDRLSLFYSFLPEQFAFTLQTARTITVNIFGEVKQQGSFNISALNTAFNALMAAGGPTEIGSVRNIQHIRGNTRKTLDIYQFMNDPAIQFDFDLQHNDIIHIPVAQKVVNLQGAVKRPKRYELKAGETLSQLIEYAGGINYDTYPDFLQIQRIEDGEEMLREWSLADALAEEASIELRDGDIIRLRPVEKPLERYVRIEGAVFYSGRYDLRQNTSLSKLLERAQLSPHAMMERIFIERTLPDESLQIIPVEWKELQKRREDVDLIRRDRVIVFDEERYASAEILEVRGDVRQPFQRRLSFGAELQLEDALILAGGTRPTAADTAYVLRTDLLNPDFIEHIAVNLVEEKDFLLQPGDQLNVYQKSTYTNVPQASIQGAVNNPFSTSYEPGLTITDLLKMAGGLTEKAQKSRIDVFRLILSPVEGTRFDRISLEIDSTLVLLPEHRHFRLMPYDQIVVRQVPMFDVDRSVQLNGQVLYPGSYLLESQLITLSDLIQEAGGLTGRADMRYATLIRSHENIGPVGIDLEKAMSRSRYERYDPVIMAGDVITIPEYSNTFRIRIHGTRLGEQNARDIIPGDAFAPGTRDEVITFVYQGPRSARWYIENFAGGFAPGADKRSVVITKRNGRVVGTTRSMLLFNNYPTVAPGSTISLEYAPESPDKEARVIDWDRVQQRTLTTTASILTLILLIEMLVN